MQPELPQTYYLDNVQILIEHVERLYHDLLDPQQLVFLHRFQSLGQDAKKLYIRLLNRSQTVFRQSKLNYAEIIDFNAAVEQLSDQGCLIVDGEIEAARLISLFTKPELLVLFDKDATLSKMKRSELDRQLIEQAQPSLCETLRQQDQLLEVIGKEQYLIFQMLFFGNLNQSMTDFVLSDLGLYQYESYTIDQSHRPYRSQLEIKQHWLLNQLELLIETSDSDQLENLIEIFASIPDDIDAQSPGYGKSDRLRNQLARQVERIGELEASLDLYQQCRQPPCRERIARILNQQQHPQQSFEVCLKIIQQPVDEAEQQFAQAFAARLAKRHQFESPVLADPGSDHYEVPIIDLTLEQQAPVEIAVALYYDQLDHNESCFYVENSLFNGVLGLLIWDIIFADNHSAFFNPFQSHPADFYRKAFIDRSQPLLDRLWASIKNNDDIGKLVSKRWQAKIGIVNPLVYWQDLNLEIIQLALERIEYEHWMVIFQRILQDLRNNRSGFPDLVRFPAQGGYQLIEVKGPGDSLQKKPTALAAVLCPARYSALPGPGYMERVIKIGVRQLVEFCCRSGDLGYDDSPGVKARDGLLIHQKIQKRYQHEARAEYPVNAHLTIDDYRIELGGRIDLVFADESPPRIEEIKTVYHHQEDDPPNSLHWAQLKCYAACYCAEKNLDQIAISLNLVNQFTAVEQRSSEICTVSELNSMLLDLLRRYLDWQQMINQQQQATALSARDLAFPFADFRKQQHRFAAEVYRAIQHQHRLLVEAPTGSGKTMSTLFPSIKALGENHCDQIIYLSAKVSGQQQAVNAIEMMIEQGLDASYLVLQAKSRCCPCNSDDNEIDEIGRCQRCIGFFDRLPAAREQLFKTRIMNIEQIQQCASDFQLCPFELALQMLEWVDIVICDFNYIFDPMVQLSYFKTNPRRKLLLIDELHNLVDRARDMYSSSLSRAQLKKAISSDNSKSISSALKTVQQSLDKFLLEQLDEYSVSRDIPQPLLRASYRFAEGLGQDLFSNKHISPETLEFAKSIFRFQCIAQLYDQHHRTIGTKPLPRRELKLLCLNAFEFLRDCYPMFHAVCGFSATLSPGQYFQQALGMDNGDPRLMIESSFPREHQLVCIGDFVDGRYQQRELHLDQICQAIQLCQHSRPGNYLAFFSSYYFMQQVYQRFGEMFPDLSTRIQQREFNAVEQQQFLDSFQEGNNQTGFAIMGGRFAEGVDLPGNALIGAILVGVGLPQANQQQQLIAQDFETMQLNGFDHAFRYPGLIRVLQSAGRVIRSETDRGIILLLDQRFKQPGYYQHLPRHWQTTRCGSLAQLELELDKFWLISG